jgi:hypothetical protein
MQNACLKGLICYTLAHWGFRYSRFSRHENRKGKCDIERNSWRKQSKRCSAAHLSRPAETQRAAQHARITYQHSLPLHSIKEEVILWPARGSLGLSDLLFLDAASGTGRRSAAHFLELVLFVLGRESRCTVQALVELDDFRVNGFELGLVEVVAGSGAEAVGAATRVGRVVGVVLELGETNWAPEIGA